MGLRVTTAADYAIRAMIHIARLPEGGNALRREIASAQAIPATFMAKILRSLVRVRLLRSSRGVKGGFSLARPASDINMLQIIEAVEGPMALLDCLPDPRGCSWSAECPAAAVWLKVQESVKDTLRGMSLEELVSTPRRNGRVESTPESIKSPAT